jgi:rubrerythrin
MPHEKLLEMIARQISVEDKAVEIYRETMKLIDNAAVKLIFEGMALDSGKHAKMYRTVENVLKTQPYSFKDFHEDRWTDKLVAKRELEKHIKMEEQMIEFLKQELTMVEQKTLKAIFDAILQDEIRHHKTLKDIISSV